MERLFNELNECELKFLDDKEIKTFEGYASTFGNEDRHGDIVEKGAFESSIGKKMPLMLRGHDPANVVGKWVDMYEDDKGLHSKGEFTPGHSVAADTYASLKHGALSGLSIGFRVPRKGYRIENDRRIIEKVELLEVSIVALPANTEAQILAVKDDIQDIETVRDLENYLRDSGFSVSAARTLAGRIKQLDLRESGRIDKTPINVGEHLAQFIHKL